MKIAEMESVAVVVVVVDTLKKALTPRDTRLAELEQRIAKLESRPLQKWAGVHVAGTQYVEASLVTRNGSLWVSTSTTTTTPGEPGSAWRLIVKRGGYDAR